MAYKLTASVLLIKVADMGLDAGGRRVDSILPGRDESYSSSGSLRRRPVALTFEGEPRTELALPESVLGFDGRPVTGKVLQLCRVVSRLPRELLVDLVLEDRESPLRAMAEMDEAKATELADVVERRGGAARHSVESLDDIHKWRAMLAQFESSYRRSPNLAREPYFPLAGWDGAGRFDAVKKVGIYLWYRAGEDWVPGPRPEPERLRGPALAVEKILVKLPYDVVVDLHETNPGDPLREVAAMGPEKAVAFADYLETHFEQVKTVFTWVKALKYFEAYWREGTCFSTNVYEGWEAATWVSRAVDLIYRRGAGAPLQQWASGMRALFDRAAGGGVTAADVAAFASGKDVLKDPRVESVSMAGSNVRIVLKEPIFARVIKHGGRTWREADDQIGMLMRQWPITAFEMIYAGNGKFPTARAYADKGCTVPARHANISDGRVCMGDLAEDGSHHSTGTLSDFIRMLMVWNLDSAYEKQASVLLKKSEPEPPGWKGAAALWAAWQPGLVEIAMGFQALPVVDPAGPGMGTVEVVQD